MYINMYIKAYIICIYIIQHKYNTNTYAKHITLLSFVSYSIIQHKRYMPMFVQYFDYHDNCD